MSSKVAFVSRERCVSCEGQQLERVWAGRFLDPPVRSWLTDYRYAADLDAALADESFERVRCITCAMTFHRIVLAPEGLQQLYGSWITEEQVLAVEKAVRVADPGYDDRKEQRQAITFRQLARHAGSGAVLVDFGCGDGSFVRAAVAARFDARGIDFSESRQGQSDKNGISIVANFDEYERAGCPSPAIVTAFEVLEHLDDPLGTLREIASRLRPGGILVLGVPDCSGIVVPTTADQFSNVQVLEHINHFTPDALTAMLDRAGFSRMQPKVVWAGPKNTARQALKRAPTTVGWFKLRS
jgi:2-polyprenyl-3-methyl-5-hydroxy-6-metoxy-1,4-benzoquinol methylase